MKAQLKAISGFGVLLVGLGLTSSLVFAQPDPVAPSSEKQDSYVSPNGKYRAVTTEPDEETILTYITDSEGKNITSFKIGSFVSWAPDSSKVLLFLSDKYSADGRKIYSLGVDGTYKDYGLPSGVISADISPKDGSVVYSLTQRGTDKSDLYLRGLDGKESKILEGQENILAWVRWSPQGDRVLYMQSDLSGTPSSQGVWLINPDGSNVEKVSAVDWNHPTIWSSDGAKILLKKSGTTWEYDVRTKSLIDPSLPLEEVLKESTEPSPESEKQVDENMATSSKASL